MKPRKIFECSCVDGFTGEFCEFKTEHDHILVFDWNNPLVFNGNGQLIDEYAVIEDEVDVYRSCSTMLNGEAVIFGGWESRYNRQVLFKIHMYWVEITFNKDCGSFRMHNKASWRPII